jgi:ABC-type transport system involved in cytochrome c biogenesis permease subunit
MTAVVIVYLLVWVPLVFAGRTLGRRRGNPDAGFWLPVLLGALGFAMFAAITAADGAAPRRG